MSNQIPTISDAESRVMEVLWRKAPQASEEIVATLEKPTGWHKKTIRTLLSRLLRKGAVEVERDGRRYLYLPVLARETWQAQESRNLLDRVFGGRVAPLLAHFSRYEKLGDKDLADLCKLIGKIEKSERRHD